MSNQRQNAELEWRDGDIPVAVRFDDPYFSTDDGMAETAFVFLAGNNLPARFCQGFHVAELGFGTGLNLLCLWQLWLQSEQAGQLHFTSFEAFPLTIEQMKRAHSVWPALQDVSDTFFRHWDDATQRLETNTLKLEVIQGDARQTLPNWNAKADAWFLDGFSPAKNPELWGGDLMAQVARHTLAGGSFATYTAAGHVRHSLASAGFEVTRVKGFGRKRHMSVGTLTPE